MFEKEAEDKAFEKYPLSDRCDKIDFERNLKYEEGFKDGAEFGYNKANEKYSELSKAVFELKGEFMACPLDDTDRLGELIDRLNNL